MIVKTDCKYYAGDRPCRFSKEEGVKCDDCPYYSPVGFKILIIKLDALGDVLRTTCLLPSLKKKYPHSHITWVTLPAAKELFINNPLVDEVLNFESTSTLYKILNIEYDLLIHPDASPQSASLASLVKAKEKRGYALNENGKVIPFNDAAIPWLEMGVFDELKKANTKTYQQHIHEIAGLNYDKKEIQIFLSDEEKKIAKDFYDSNKLSRFKILLGLNTGASKRWQLKQWRYEGFIELIGKLEKNPEIGILIYGGEDEVERNAELKKQFPRIIDTGTSNTLRQFFALMNLSDIILTGDTLALHVATALRKKVICYFGPTSANEIESYGRITKIQPDMDCLVCYKPECDFNPNCMQLISADRIYETIMELKD